MQAASGAVTGPAVAFNTLSLFGPYPLSLRRITAVRRRTPGKAGNNGQGQDRTSADGSGTGSEMWQFVSHHSLLKVLCGDAKMPLRFGLSASHKSSRQTAKSDHPERELAFEAPRQSSKGQCR